MKKNNKKAFSLVEMIMAMLIIAIVSFAMLPILTRPKPQIETVGVRGQFGCYYKGSTLHQVYYDERTERTDEIASGGQCTFKFDLRPKKYFILMAGAGARVGTVNKPGQIVTDYTDKINSNLTISVPPANSPDHTIMRKDDGMSHMSAGSGASMLNNGLVPENINACRLLSAGGNCSDSNYRQVGCDTPSYSTVENKYVIDVACMYTGSDADMPLYHHDYIPLENFSVNTGSVGFSEYLANLNGKQYKVNFELKDSMYTFNDLIVKKPTTNGSRIERILTNINFQRKSQMIQDFIDGKFGEAEKAGAVLILW